ncbi:MAG: 2,3-diphosphoglycerate-dependent phosphoglycerate mutase [Candidatus Saccharibacteria bacterium]|nr:2,3-diphosphoglycerate-dependent phosphoglycerate mutase [Candidatus Saccharibacteria bacterium]
MGVLVISRHGESEWNVLGKWTGWTDVGLTDKGVADTVRLGALLKDIQFDAAYTSALKRTHQTLDALLEGAGIAALPVVRAAELNERDYGDLTGKNKWEVKEEIGEEAFNSIRRGWDYPVPGGETLKDVYHRVLPYFEREVLPRLQAGENILLVAHGNSIRALMKHLDQIDEAEMAHVEMSFGQVLVYRFDNEHALPVDKEVRSVEIAPVNA